MCYCQAPDRWYCQQDSSVSVRQDMPNTGNNTPPTPGLSTSTPNSRKRSTAAPALSSQRRLGCVIDWVRPTPQRLGYRQQRRRRPIRGPKTEPTSARLQSSANLGGLGSHLRHLAATAQLVLQAQFPTNSIHRQTLHPLHRSLRRLHPDHRRRNRNQRPHDLRPRPSKATPKIRAANLKLSYPAPPMPTLKSSSPPPRKKPANWHFTTTAADAPADKYPPLTFDDFRNPPPPAPAGGGGFPGGVVEGGGEPFVGGCVCGGGGEVPVGGVFPGRWGGVISAGTGGGRG